MGRVPKPTSPFGALPGEGRESLCWEEDVGNINYELYLLLETFLSRAHMRRWATSPFLQPCLRV